MTTDDAAKLDEVFEPPSLPTDFGFTEDHDLARQQARRFLAEHSSMETVRALVDDPVGYDPATWKQIGELGWIGLVSDEAHGGAGLDHLQLTLLFEEMGRALLPSPFFGTLLALHAIELAGSDAQKERWVPGIVTGETIATLALSEPDGPWGPDATRTQAKKSGSGATLVGTKTHVLFGQAAKLMVVPAASEDGSVGLYVVDPSAKGVSIEAEVCVDTTRRTARVSLDETPAERLEGDGAAALRAVHVRGTAMLAAEMVGGIESTLGLTRDYAADREQFGRKIGSFQAVKHPLVDIMCGVELARSQALAAAAAIDSLGIDDPKTEIAARMTKALASDTFAFATRKGVQLHGGYGFTFDCDVHFFFKRALWSRATLGDAAHQRRHLAAALFDRDD